MTNRQHTQLAGTTTKRPEAPLVRDEEATANAMLTTAVDTCGRPWTQLGPNASSGLVSQTVVDS